MREMRKTPQGLRCRCEVSASQRLTDGDLKHTVDFRSVFATMAQGC